MFLVLINIPTFRFSLSKIFLQLLIPKKFSIYNHIMFEMRRNFMHCVQIKVTQLKLNKFKLYNSVQLKKIVLMLLKIKWEKNIN